MIIKQLTDKILAGILLIDPLLFLLFFWQDDFSLPPSREQKLMFCDESDKICVCTGRKIAKTIMLERDIIQVGITHTSNAQGITEGLFFTPNDPHMKPVLDRVFGRISRVDLFNLMKKQIRRGDNPTIEFYTGFMWYFRIEGTSGTDRNMVGLRAAYVIGDEMAFGNWVCHNSRLQTALPWAKWKYCGVPNGVRDTPFYAIDQKQEGKGWSHHKYPTFINPIYHDKEAIEELKTSYGGTETQGYKTQVLGQWGEETVSSFPPGTIATSTKPFFNATLSGDMVSSHSLDTILQIPIARTAGVAVGWDYGFSPDPAVVIFAVKYNDGPDWYEYAKITMNRVSLKKQVEIILYVLRNFIHGPVYNIATDNIEGKNLIEETNFPVIWSFPGNSSEVLDENGNPILDASGKPVKRRNKEHYTNLLRSALVAAVRKTDAHIRFYLSDQDTELIDELIGTTERRTQSGYVVYYGPPDPLRKGGMRDHNTDACRYLIAGIYDYLFNTGQIYKEEEILSALGWVKAGQENWKPPWS